MFIKRSIFKELQAEIDQPEILILLGPRQVGKTTLLQELNRYAISKGLKTKYLDLEQPQILAEFNKSDQQIIDLIGHSGDIIFIDEFQYIKNASRILKAVYDRRLNIKIICSGSSSLEIHKHLKESLAGRRFLYRIYPLSYSEIKNSLPDFCLDDYLIFGGMPGLVQYDSAQRKQQMLNEFLGSYILKDVKSLVNEENIRAFNHLLYLLADNQGTTISVHSLSGEIGLSATTINRYLDILEGTYVNFRIYSFSRNLGNELKKSCKTYLYDTGIRNAILRDFSDIQQRPDKGVLRETFVFLKLQSMVGPNMEIRFWRTKSGDEVDFIVVKNRIPVPIEVKSVISETEIPRGLRRFISRYPGTRAAFVVNESVQGQINFDGCRVQFMTFEDFGENFQVS